MSKRTSGEQASNTSICRGSSVLSSGHVHSEWRDGSLHSQAVRCGESWTLEVVKKERANGGRRVGKSVSKRTPKERLQARSPAFSTYCPGPSHFSSSIVMARSGAKNFHSVSLSRTLRILLATLTMGEPGGTHGNHHFTTIPSSNMPTDDQSLRAGEPPQDVLHSTITASPLQPPVAPVSSRIGSAIQGATDIHNDAPTIPWVIDCLSDLPNELLDSIALYFGGSKIIPDLACVNKRLCRVAQYAMMRRLCVPKNGPRRVLEMLATSSADAVSKICHLDLSKLVHGQNNLDQAHLIALLPSLRELTICLPPHGDAFQARPLIRSPNHQIPPLCPFRASQSRLYRNAYECSRYSLIPSTNGAQHT